MIIYQKLYVGISKSFKYKSVKKIKRMLRPIKWALFGKKGIYKAIELTKELERKSGKGNISSVFDIGAADGEYAFTLAQSFPEATVYCFEPQSVSYPILKSKVKQFGDRIKSYKIGFYNQNSSLALNLDLAHPDSSSILPSLETVKSPPPRAGR